MDRLKELIKYKGFQVSVCLNNLCTELKHSTKVSAKVYNRPYLAPQGFYSQYILPKQYQALDTIGHVRVVVWFETVKS